MTTTMDAPKTAAAQVKASAAKPARWFDEPMNRWLAVGAGAVALALIVWFVVLSGARKQEFASRALQNARNVAESGNLAQAAAELQRVVTTYSGTDAAQEAVLTLNQVRMTNGQSALAIAGLQDFIKSKPDQKYLPPAYGLLGSAFENTNQPDSAAAAYTGAAKSASLEYLKAQYQLEAARAYRNAGKADQAVAAYRTIINDLGDNPFKTEAKVRLAELTKGSM